MNKATKGDRVVQGILLLLIAAGIGSMIYLHLDASAPRGAAGPGGRSAAAGGREKESAVAVVAGTLEPGDLAQSIHVNGDVTVDTAVEIFSDAAGKVVSQPVKLGDSIKKDDVIMTVDPSLPGQVYSVNVVRSTIGGTVIDLPYQEGDRISTSAAIATVGDLNDLVVETYIPERFVAVLKTGLAAAVTLDAFPGEEFPARISELNPVMDANTRTLSVKLKFTRRDRRIRPGMFATIRLITRERRGVLAVPRDALLSYYGDSVVFVINKEDRAERRVVTTGLSTDDQIEITRGLEPGDRVILQGQKQITEGTLVRVVSLEN